MKHIWLMIIMGLGTCRELSVPEGPLMKAELELKSNRTLRKIAFGSCNKETRDQHFWSRIAARNPDLWIWLGDNVYGDTEDMDLLVAKYKIVKYNPHYQKLLATCPVIGIWDDHDYGVNDGGKNFSKKEESQQILLDFLDVPYGAEVRAREGIYQAYNFGPKGKKVKFILLDTRYFRDDLDHNPVSRDRYRPNEKGDVLGEAQWHWLEEQLLKRDADLHLIASGYQIIPEEQRYEKWSNFPAARQRLFDLLVQTQAKNVILLSGDRHISELSRIELAGRQDPLYEFTSSGLTHTWGPTVPRPEANRYRVGEMVIEKSYGMMHFDWAKNLVKVKLQARGMTGKVLLEKEIRMKK